MWELCEFQTSCLDEAHRVGLWGRFWKSCDMAGSALVWVPRAAAQRSPLPGAESYVSPRGT